MVHQSVIYARMSQLGIKVSSWYKPEIKELSQILMDNEEIIAIITGRYYGGYALLVATGQRLLLIDKKTMFMSLEDIRYDMISEIDYSARIFDATITIFTVNKQHKFTSVKHKDQMRQLTVFVQKRIMEIRQPQNVHELAREMEEDDHHYAVANRHYEKQNQQDDEVISRRAVSVHLRGVGSSAIRGAHRSSAINPYTNGSLTIKSNWTRSQGSTSQLVP